MLKKHLKKDIFRQKVALRFYATPKKRACKERKPENRKETYTFQY